MDLHRWKAKFFDDIRVFDRQGFTQSLALDPFGRQAGAGNRTAAAKCLKFGVLDDSGFFINFDLKLHYVAALRRSYKAGAHIDRKSTRLNSSHSQISYAVFCLKKKKNKKKTYRKMKNHHAIH